MAPPAEAPLPPFQARLVRDGKVVAVVAANDWARFAQLLHNAYNLETTDVARLVKDGRLDRDNGSSIHFREARC